MFDQFEELLRQHRADARKLMSWVRSVADTYDFRIILSLRSDAQHLLDPLLKGFPAYTVDRLTVTSFTDDQHVKNIIESRRPLPDLPEVEVTNTVTNAILAAWRNSESPRLLGLQALLSALYFAARDDPRHPEQARVVIDDVTLREVAGSAPDLFEAGMFSFVTRALEQAEQAAVDCGIDSYLRYGAKELVSRTTQYLWSGGFKVPAVEQELAERILAPELRLLASRDRSATAGLGNLVTSMLDSDDLLNFGVEEARGADTATSSRNDVTAGPLLGRSSASAVVEEARRAAFAIAWLTATGIAKRTGARMHDRKVTLVHDGSGVALEDWARLNRGGIDYDAHRLTAARGEHLDFTSDPRIDEIGWLLDDPPMVRRVLPNLNWRDCRITARFTDVVFLNCDFSGARFEGCRLEAVTFVNCLLDDANFETCEIIGLPGVVPAKRQEHDASKVRIAPSFVVPVEAEMADAFCAYSPGGTVADGTTKTFFSNVVGSPTLPGAAPEGHCGEVIPLPIAQGGVAFVGGRISFLTFHSCGSPLGEDGRSEGAIEFYYAGGGGLDIVEPSGTSVVLYDCAVRGISVTRDQQEQSGASASESGRVTFRANDSFLVYVYFSGALRGEAAFRSSVLWGVVNASGALASGEPSLSMTVGGCRHQFIVNADSIDADSIEDSEAMKLPPPYFVQRPGDVSVFDARDTSALAEQLDFMDFRRESEVRELRQRQRWADDNG